MQYAESMRGYYLIKSLGQGVASSDIDIIKDEPIHISASFGLTLLDPDIPVGDSIVRADT